jgi:serine phosphatase RsbU (regulator of sigma subunit)
VFRELEKAKAIQAVSLRNDLPQDARIRFSTHYVPHDIVGGDYYAIGRLDNDPYDDTAFRLEDDLTLIEMHLVG